MYAAVNAWTFAEDTPPEAQLAAAAAAGFGGIELVVSTDGPLRLDTPSAECAALAQAAESLRLRICGVACAMYWETNFGSADERVRERAAELTVRMLDRAADLGAGSVLVVPAVVGRSNDARMQVPYADALKRTFDALSRLRDEAESRDVVIAVENVWNRFLLSPVELADLIDRVNSSHVGVYFDTGNVLAFGYPEDWIATLGGRIRRVHAKDYDVSKPGSAGFCPLGEGSVDWPRVTAALQEAGYDGPLTYEGSGDLVDVHRRLEGILAGGGQVPAP